MKKLASTVISLALTACGIDAVGRLAREDAPAEPATAAPSSPAAQSPAADGDAGADASDEPTTIAACSDRALAFDGADDFATVPASAALDLAGDFTVEAWIKPGARATTGEEMHVVSRHDRTMSRGWSLLVRSRRVEIVVWGSDTLGSMAYSAGNAGPEYVVANQWIHVAGTFSERMLRIYVGGVLRDTQLLGSDFVRAADTQAMIIGRPAFTSAQFFEGVIDDVRLSSVARATGDTIPIPAAPHATDGSTVALYRFDETGGPTIVDSSNGGAHGGTIGSGTRAPARVVVPCASSR